MTDTEIIPVIDLGRLTWPVLPVRSNAPQKSFGLR
jgi:hypothetical protein